MKSYPRVKDVRNGIKKDLLENSIEKLITQEELKRIEETYKKGIAN